MDVKAFWKAIVSKNDKTLHSYFSDDAVVRWHCTNEQFTAAEYIHANCDYPGKRKGEIERLEEFNSKTILVGKVKSEDETITCHVTSFIKLQDDKVIEMDEYWSDDGEAPQWRKELGKSYSLNSGLYRQSIPEKVGYSMTCYQDKISDILNKKCFTVDILPETVPTNSEGQYFDVEYYLLNGRQREAINEKFVRVILKLMCYYHVAANWGT